jgi:antitoxin component HigA of HigAB toxin-antitoxin module
MGKSDHEWQDRAYVLNWFGNKGKEAVKAYRSFVMAGIDEGKRPDLVGGGLIRSLGGWSEVQSMRRRKGRQLTDERILGSGEFVERILNDAEEDERLLLSAKERLRTIKETIKAECASKGIQEDELKAGGRRAIVAEVRAKIARKLVGEHGMTLAEVARNVGVSTAAISKIMSGRRKLN